MLSQERAAMLASYLNSDIERAKELLSMSPETAVVKINASGYDFSLEEIVEFGSQLQAAAEQDGELTEESLCDVAGGLVVAGVAISCIALGYKIGSDLAKKHGW